MTRYVKVANLAILVSILLPFVAIASEDDFEGIERQAKLFKTPLSQFRLARYYEAGKDVGKDDVKAMEYYILAAEGGNDYAQLELGFRQRDPVKSFFWFSKAAAQGNASGQFTLGSCYLNGAGVELNAVEAVKHFRLAAAQGLPEAQRKLAECYEKGVGIEVDLEMAKLWRSKADRFMFGDGIIAQEYAHRGNSDGQYRIGLAYSSGRGVPVDLSEAASWFKKAAELGHAEAQLLLGIAYDFGKGIEKNVVKAGYWYQRAAKQGDPQAQFILGVCYAQGSGGLVKDAVRSAEWFRKSALQGNPEAQFNLGNRYARGDGVPRDDIEAYAFLNIAGLKVDAAKVNLGVLEESMSPAARLLGQQRTKELRKEIEGQVETLKDLQRAIEKERSLRGA